MCWSTISLTLRRRTYEKKSRTRDRHTTSGLGYSAAKQLAQDGWIHVIVTGRSQARVDEAVSRLKTDTGTQNITGIAVDLDSFASVKKAVAELVKRGVPIDFLVLNAGMVPGKERVVTSENIESLQAPLIGHHQLTLGLLAAGLLAPGARIVIAGAEAARGDVPMFRFTDLAAFAAKEYKGDLVSAVEAILRSSPKVKYNPYTAYSDAKLFVALGRVPCAKDPCRYGRIRSFTRKHSRYPGGPPSWFCYETANAADHATYPRNVTYR